MARDVVQVAPGAAKVIFENDKVRVIEIKIRKGQKLPMHSHVPNLIYAVTSGKWKSTSGEGKSELSKVKAGESSWSEGTTHAVEAHTKIVLLQIEPK
jgi:quercetin dioxygenase-like cupin family protein